MLNMHRCKNLLFQRKKKFQVILNNGHKAYTHVAENVYGNKLNCLFSSNFVNIFYTMEIFLRCPLWLIEIVMQQWCQYAFCQFTIPSNSSSNDGSIYHGLFLRFQIYS